MRRCQQSALSFYHEGESQTAVKEASALYAPAFAKPDDARVYEAIAGGIDSRRELQEKMGFSLTKTVNILRRLQDEGKIRRIGNGNRSRYGVGKV